MVLSADMLLPMPGLLAEQASAVHLLSFYKPILIVLGATPYAWLISSVIDKDVRYYHLNEKGWNALTVGTLLVGLAAVLLIPWFWLGFPLMLVMYASVSYAYWKYRDPKVPEAKRFDLFAGKWAERAAQRKAAKAFGVVTASYADSKGNRQIPPEKDSPLFEVHLATELIILSALPLRASRIDLTPGANAHQSSVVIDGVRIAREGVPSDLGAKMVDYLKTAAGLDTKDRRKRVRGAIKMTIGKGTVNLLLTAWGASAGQTMRIDIEREKQLTLAWENLGLLAPQVEAITQGLADVKEGVVLVAAAPGQGLTALAYSLLARHDSYTNNIKTLERFVERKLEGIDHVEWDSADASADFATKLQSVVRRGPDIVLASDLTDPGAGQVLVHPNNTGVLFYALLPTDNSQVAIATYLKAAGDPKSAAARLRLVVTQRLVRTLCPECRQPYQATPEQAKRLGVADGKALQLFRASGKVQSKNEIIACPACQGTGFIGITGVFEVLRMNDSTAAILATGDTAGAYTAIRRAFKTPTAQDCGLAKVRSGVTSLEEIARVFAPKAPPKPATAATQAPAAKAPAKPR